MRKIIFVGNFLNSVTLGCLRYTLRHIYQESKATLHAAFPLIVAQVGQLSMSIVDNIMVGRLGPEPLAALAIANVLHFFFFLLVLGTLSILRNLVAEQKAQGHLGEIGVYMRQGLLLCIPFTLLAAVAFALSDKVFRLMGQPPELFTYVNDYLNVLVWGLPFIYGFICLRQINEGNSDAKPSMWLVFFAALLNIPLNYSLIYGKIGLPALGIAGAALATSILSFLMFVALWVYLAKSRQYKPYRLFEWPSLQQSHKMWLILKLGIPLSGTRLGEVAFFMSAALLMGRLGSLELAAHQIAINAAAMTFMMPLGMSFSQTVRIAEAAGRREYQEVIFLGWVGFLLGAVIMLPSAFIFYFFPRAIAALYSQDAQLIAMAIPLIQLAAVFQIFDGVQILGVGILQGLRDTRIPFLNILISFYILALPLAYYLGLVKAWRGSGIWLGIVVGLLVVAILHMLRFKSLTRQFPG